MYVQYKTNSTWLASDLMSDIVAIITGTSNIASLSSSCDKANSSVLINTISSAWTVHDPMTGDANYTKVLTAPDYTGSTNKYVRLKYVTGNPLTVTLYSSWNNVTHTGTDPTNEVNVSTGTAYTTTSPVLIYIYTTSSTIGVVMSQTGAPTVTFTIGEIRRDSGFTDYYNPVYLKSNIFMFSGNYSQGGWLSRHKKMDSTGDLTPGYCAPVVLTAYVDGGAPYPKYPLFNTNSTNPGIIVTPLRICNINNSTSILGEAYNMYWSTSVYFPSVSVLDEIVISGNTYIVMGYYSTGYWLVPKG